MKLITDALQIKHKRVLVRVDWNVPTVEGKVRDSFRIKQSLATLNYLCEIGAEVLIATHLEDGGSIEALEPFVPKGAKLLTNLRENPGEEANSEEFAKELASQADIYVNEAFSVSHRLHASIVGVPKLLPSYAGLRFAQEIKELSRSFYPPHPFLVILGGKKIETKLPLVEKFLHTADDIFIGGAMAEKASTLPLAKERQVFFPIGPLSAPDSNPETMEILKDKIAQAKFIIWNGPLGKYEEGYAEHTLELARLLSEAKAETIVGGGDTLASIEALNLLDKFSFVSTGGGAMLEFLGHGTLPGIEALS